jgi:hypothetical protein
MINSRQEDAVASATDETVDGILSGTTARRCA